MISRVLKISNYWKVLVWIWSHVFSIPRHSFIEISTKVGCPVKCKHCPQKIHIKRYFADGTGKQLMDLGDFKGVVDKALPGSTISFAGFAEPFANPQCTDMVEYALAKCEVCIFTTLVGLSVDDYERFRNHPNLLVFVVHLPDNEGATSFRVNDEYLSVLSHVLNHPPTRGLTTKIHGRTVHSAISHIVKAPSEEVTYLHDRGGNVEGEGILKVHFPTGKIRCGHAWLRNSCGSGLVLPDGRTLVCCSDFSMSYVIGNAFQQTIPEMIRSEKYQLCLTSCDNEKIDSICRHCGYAFQLKHAHWRLFARIQSILWSRHVKRVLRRSKS